eukprot:CCRYP_011142-RA/>CCRYP_011142-RA protein AED:0.22 eAED:0.51 QI:0/0/0/1/1/1/2/0/256
MTDSALEVFQLYANLLTEEARQPWDLIVKEQTESSPFHDILESKGRSHRARRPSHSGGASYSTSNRVLHMTGENLKFYISNCLKKPNKVRWQDQYHLLEKCYPEGVKPLLLILERIEVAHPVDERQSPSKPAKAQGAEQPSKKFALGARPQEAQASTHGVYARRQELQAMQKHGAHTPRITPRSVAVQQRRNSTRGTFGKLHESPARTVAPRSPTPRSWLIWRNLRSLSRKPTKRQETPLAKKVTAIRLILKCWVG